MKIIIGLGNIGDKYIKTRHNAGFLALDQLVAELEKEGISISWKEESKLKAITAKVPYGEEVLYLVKPNTLMNLSGLAASKILNFFKEPINNLITLYDDIDLPLGEIRFREKGSAGTHNGMKSMIKELGSEEFKRIRIGIESRGTIAHKNQDLHSFVLGDFLEEEYPLIEKSLKSATQEIRSIISA
jgi:peptidyl-tRNA hydrolase, PTH1 family